MRLTEVLRLEVERPRDLGELVNLVVNPSGDLGAWGWVTPLAGGVLRSVEVTGVRSLRLTSPGGAASRVVTESMPVAAGRHVAVSWVAAQVDGRYSVRLEWIDGAGATSGSTAATGLLLASADRQFYGTFLAPAGTTRVRLRFDHFAAGGGNPAAGATLTLREVTVADAAASTNLRTVRTNLVTNPSGEVNASGWLANDGSSVTSSTLQAFVGSRSLRFARGGTVGPLAAASAQIDILAGRDYTFTTRLRAQTTLRKAVIYARWLTAAGVRIGADVVISSYQETAGVWSGVRGGSVTAPTTAGRVQLVVLWGNVAANEAHFLDAVMVEEGTAATGYFDGSTAAAGGVTYAWTGTAHASASTATSGTGTIGPLATVTYQNILGSATEVTVTRQELDPGQVDVVLLDPELDPSTSPLIRPGRRVRLVTTDGQSLIPGKITPDSIAVAYEPLAVNPAKRTRITFSAVDVLSALVACTRPEGVATVDELPYVLEGCGVPWSVNGSGDQVPTAEVVAYNSAATALDQVVVTRDTARGFAWVDRNGVLQAWDAAEIPADEKAVLTETDYAPDFASGFDPNSCVNIVDVVALTVVATSGAVEEVRYGPFRDEESILENGEHPGTYTVQGSTWDSTSAAAYAATILATNADPRRRVRETTIAISDVAKVPLGLLDLQDRVHIQNTRADLSEVSRVTSIRHQLVPGNGIKPSKWLVTYGFAGESVAAPPLVVTAPPPAQTAVKDDVNVSVAAVEVIATDAATAASDAQTTATAAATAAAAAQTTADDKNTTTFSASVPGSTPNTAGDLWFQTASGVVLTQWQGNGGTSWTQRTFSGTALAADAIDGKTITGATLRTAGSGERVVVRNDGSGGVIEFFAGISGETPGYVDPGTSEYVGSSMALVSGKTTGAEAARLSLGERGVSTPWSNSTDKSIAHLRARTVWIGGSLGTGVPGGEDIDSVVWIFGNLTLPTSARINASMGAGSVGTGTFRDSVDARVTAAVKVGEFIGSTDGSAQVTITHGLGSTPSSLSFAGSETYGSDRHRFTYDNVTSTTFRVTVRNNTAGLVSSPTRFMWQAWR